MWVATIDGFYSAVQHRQKPETLIVRARLRGDLEQLCRVLQPGDSQQAAALLATIEDSPKADYPFRVELAKTTWAAYLVTAAVAVDYDNFKNAVYAKSGPAREAVYHRVWAALRGLERQAPAAAWPCPLVEFNG